MTDYYPKLRSTPAQDAISTLLELRTFLIEMIIIHRCRPVSFDNFNSLQDENSLLKKTGSEQEEKIKKCAAFLKKS